MDEFVELVYQMRIAQSECEEKPQSKNAKRLKEGYEEKVDSWFLNNRGWKVN
jgi:hypothetical protein